ncbi:sensor histidine kinase [Gorillibacterium sp. sgz5001074]|uniref:sensor histidine kinase n=1 Tax=Gorillibacterium sp. sgz5001074 TaxID=3446695 RepID=UPI003F6676C9
MRLKRFLRYERPYLLAFAASFGLTVSVLYAELGAPWRWGTFWYAAALNLLLGAGFFLYRYLKQVQAMRQLDADDTEPLSLQAEACLQALEEQEREHIRSLNDVQLKRGEYYDFVASWFHEIKTPISVIRLMQQTEMSPAALEQEVARIEHYVDLALYYAKLDSFSQDYEITSCDLGQMAKEAVKSHSKAFISRRIRLHLEVLPEKVQSDPKWLLFILNQILSNSLKYTGEQGEITLASRSTPEEKQLIIRDNGIGIDPKDLPRIFNRGFSGANGRIHTKSTGMGLYLAQELCAKLGHYLTCTSDPGRCTEMVIHFPRSHDPYLHLLQQTARRSHE